MSLEPSAPSPATVRRPAQIAGHAAWSAATLAVVAASSSPSLAPLSSLQPSDDPATFLVAPVAPERSPASGSAEPSWSVAQVEVAHEFGLAQRIVHALHADPLVGRGLADVYSNHLVALQHASRLGLGDSLVERAAAVARSLRTLRSRLLDEIPAFSLWLSVRRSVDPDAEHFDVPARFIAPAEAGPCDDALMDDLVAAADLDQALAGG